MQLPSLCLEWVLGSVLVCAEGLEVDGVVTSIPEQTPSLPHYNTGWGGVFKLVLTCCLTFHTHSPTLFPFVRFGLWVC